MYEQITGSNRRPEKAYSKCEELRLLFAPFNRVLNQLM